jgi:excisionase family DNA binding protein
MDAVDLHRTGMEKGMRMQREFTVGEIARIINVARSTVIQWIREGHIDAYRLPGGNNRVTYTNLTAFMRQFSIPQAFLDHAVKKRVLLADPDPAHRDAMQRGFAGDPEFILRTAASGFQTGMAVVEFIPQAVILDTAVPGIDTAGICRQLRERSGMKHTVVIAVSGDLDPAKQKSLKRCGFDAFLGQPCTPAECRDLIRSLAGP